MYGLKDHLQKRLPNGGLLIRVSETNPPRLIAYMEAYESTAFDFLPSLTEGDS